MSGMPFDTSAPTTVAKQRATFAAEAHVTVSSDGRTLRVFFRHPPTDSLCGGTFVSRDMTRGPDVR